MALRISRIMSFVTDIQVATQCCKKDLAEGGDGLLSLACPCHPGRPLLVLCAPTFSGQGPSPGARRRAPESVLGL